MSVRLGKKIPPQAPKRSERRKALCSFSPDHVKIVYDYRCESRQQSARRVSFQECRRRTQRRRQRGGITSVSRILFGFNTMCPFRSQLSKNSFQELSQRESTILQRISIQTTRGLHLFIVLVIRGKNEASQHDSFAKSFVQS